MQLTREIAFFHIFLPAVENLMPDLPAAVRNKVTKACEERDVMIFKPE